jgi:prepilin-type N-terminal cleavage/methylation domain-containing protein
LDSDVWIEDNPDKGATSKRREGEDMSALSDRRARAAFTLSELLVVIAIIAVLVALLLLHMRRSPRSPRAYYEGKDQFYWMTQLHEKDVSNHEEAVTALSHILLEARFPCRCMVLRSLAQAGPRARKAVPALETMLERDADRELWDDVRDALQKIAPERYPPAQTETAAKQAAEPALRQHGPRPPDFPTQ